MLFICSCISWNDSCGSLKATFLGGPVIRHIASEGLITSQLAGTMLMRVLQGLQFHGQHDANQVIFSQFKSKYVKLP